MLQRIQWKVSLPNGTFGKKAVIGFADVNTSRSLVVLVFGNTEEYPWHPLIGCWSKSTTLLMPGSSLWHVTCGHLSDLPNPPNSGVLRASCLLKDCSTGGGSQGLCGPLWFLLSNQNLPVSVRSHAQPQLFWMFPERLALDDKAAEKTAWLPTVVRFIQEDF